MANLLDIFEFLSQADHRILSVPFIQFRRYSEQHVEILAIGGDRTPARRPRCGVPGAYAGLDYIGWGGRSAKIEASKISGLEPPSPIESLKRVVWGSSRIRSYRQKGGPSTYSLHCSSFFWFNIKDPKR